MQYAKPGMRHTPVVTRGGGGVVEEGEGGEQLYDDMPADIYVR